MGPCTKMGSNRARPRQNRHPVQENGVKSCTAPAKQAPRARKWGQIMHGPGKTGTPCTKMGSNHARPRQNGYPVHEKGVKSCTAPAKQAPRARKRGQIVHGPGKMATPCKKMGSNRARGVFLIL